MINKEYRILYVTVIFTIVFSSCVNKKANPELAKAHMETVISEVVKVKNVFEERNQDITAVYNGLSSGNANRDNNIIRLEHIKTLSIDISNQTKKSLSVLNSKLKQNDTVRIYKIGIKYLETVQEIEPMLPVLYRKMNDDIMGKQTSANDTITKAGQKINNAGKIYKALRDEYDELNQKKTGS